MHARTGMTEMTAALGVAVAITLFPAPAKAQITFTEVTADAGIDEFIYRTDTAHALGVAWIDFNKDDLPDLFFVNGINELPHMYQNNGDGTFTNVDELLPALPNQELMSAIYADYDNDGDSDLYIFVDNEVLTTGAPNPIDGPANLLLKNLWVENGNAVSEPLFEEVAAAAGVQHAPDVPFGPDYDFYRSNGGSWLDYDRDGWIDLYVGTWAAGHPGDPANQDRLYRNLGDGTFEDVTATCGLHLEADPDSMRPALAIIGAHIDQDLWPDVYVANVAEPSPHHHDFCYFNAADGTFVDDIASSPGVGDDGGAAMGITIADIDLDGDWDMYISDLWDPGNDADPRGNPFYLNNGDGTFADNTADVAGIQAGDSWGVNFFDADQDGFEDLFVNTMPGADLDHYFYQNDHNGSFTEMTAAAGLIGPLNGGGRGSAVADYDGDGDLDLLTVYKDGFPRLYRNDTPDAGNWLKVRLDAVCSNRDAIGTLVKVTKNGKVLMRQVIGGYSAHSQDSLELHFGLARTGTVDQVEVLWPSGAVTTLTNVLSNQTIEVTEAFVGDLNADCAVNVSDLLDMLADWGPCVGCAADLNGDDVVNIGDLLVLLANWS